MKIVMELLQLEIPPFLLRRRVCVVVDDSETLTVSAVDFDATPASIFAGVIVNNTKLESEPFSIKLNDEAKVILKLFFFGHYNEPPVELQLPISAKNTKKIILIYFITHLQGNGKLKIKEVIQSLLKFNHVHLVLIIFLKNFKLLLFQKNQYYPMLSQALALILKLIVHI